MSSVKQHRADISGIDWMISFIRWKSRSLPSGGNNFTVIAHVSDAFDFESFEKRFQARKKMKSFLSGRVKRKFPDWTPRWYWGKDQGEGMICAADRESTAVEVTNVLPRGTALEVLYVEKAKQLLFTFSHAVFDGTGAEKMIAFLLEGEMTDVIPERTLPVDIPAMKQNGKALQAFMKEIPEKKILRLPESFSTSPNEFRTLTVSPEEFTGLEKAVEEKYGPFTLSLYILAVVLCNLEKYVFPADAAKEYVFIPMSVDQRNQKPGEENMFFNHWSLMPLLISREILRKGVPETIQHLRLLYAGGLAARTPRIFAAAADAMKYIPFRIIDLIVKREPAKTLGTLMFSFLNTPTPGNGEITNLAHCPNMPYGNNLGFFVNLCNSHLNIVISRRAWQDEGNFELFCREIQKQLREETT